MKRDFAVFMAILLVMGCIGNHTISIVEEEQDDTEHRDSVSMVARMKESRDTIRNDTIGSPIIFDVTINEWDEGGDIEL